MWCLLGSPRYEDAREGRVQVVAIVALTMCEGARVGHGLRMPARVGERFFAPPRYCSSSS